MSFLVEPFRAELDSILQLFPSRGVSPFRNGIVRLISAPEESGAGGKKADLVDLTPVGRFIVYSRREQVCRRRKTVILRRRTPLRRAELKKNRTQFTTTLAAPRSTPVARISPLGGAETRKYQKLIKPPTSDSIKPIH